MVLEPYLPHFLNNNFSILFLSDLLYAHIERRGYCCSSGKGYPYSRYDVKFVALKGFENNLPLSVARRAYFLQKICHTANLTFCRLMKQWKPHRLRSGRKKKSMDMKRTEKNKENNVSYLPLSIKWVLTVALVCVCVWCVTKTGASPLWVAGVYILIRSVLKIIRLSIRIILSLVSLLCLILICMAIVVFIL